MIFINIYPYQIFTKMPLDVSPGQLYDLPVDMLQRPPREA